MTLVTLLLTLVACPTASSGACPTDVPLGDADLPCTCAGETVDALPGCGDIECTAEGTVTLDEGCETGGCKGVDCG